MRKAGLSDDVLCKAVDEMANGLVDADLGGYVVKKRVALAGQGKRSGARIIVATKLADRWFLLFGFGKNELATALMTGEIMEVCNGNDQTQEPHS